MVTSQMELVISAQKFHVSSFEAFLITNSHFLRDYHQKCKVTCGHLLLLARIMINLTVVHQFSPTIGCKCDLIFMPVRHLRGIAIWPFDTHTFVCLSTCFRLLVLPSRLSEHRKPPYRLQKRILLLSISLIPWGMPTNNSFLVSP